jgi:hypothetical protein
VKQLELLPGFDPAAKLRRELRGLLVALDERTLDVLLLGGRRGRQEGEKQAKSRPQLPWIP